MAITRIQGGVIAANGITSNLIAANSITYGMLSPTLFATQNNVYNVVTANANTAVGNTYVTFTSNTAAINAGMIIYGGGFGRGTTVSTVVNANTILLSTAAANTATNTRISFVEPNRVVTADVVGPGLCKAWVIFAGTATTTATLIRGAFNVSSVTDIGTGNFIVNFTQALPDTNYSAVATSGFSLGWCIINNAVGPSTTQLNVYTSNNGGTAEDKGIVSVAVFR